jgi:AmiR/NasT family two-component response regulator
MAAVRILIAEDNEPVAQGLEEQLNALGYEVVGIARNGVEVLRSCEQLRPDLVIVDLQLPEHGGAVVTKQIVERTPTAVVIMTAFAGPESIRRGILMKRMHLGEPEAETRLRQRAKEKGVRVQDMAQAIVDSDALLS